MNEVDVIILDLDGGSLLEACLRSIDAQSEKPARVVIWDNGSRTPVTDRLPPISVPLVVHRSETNLGFAGGMNAALELSSAEFVALINNDVTLHPEWLQRCRASLTADERRAAVQSIIGAPDGTIDGAGIDISNGTIRQSGHRADSTSAVERDPWGVSATATLYRRAALREAADPGIFDERFFAYYEDVELCARLRDRGWRFALIAETLAQHRGSASASLVDALYLRTRNRYLVHRLHPEVGRLTALLGEDLRLLLKELPGLHWGQVSSRLRGIVNGFSMRL